MSVSPDQKPAETTVHKLLAAFDLAAVPTVEAPSIAPSVTPAEAPAVPVVAKPDAVEIKASDEKSAEEKPSDVAASDAPAAEAKPDEIQASETKPVEGTPDAKAAEPQVAEAKPVEAKLDEAAPATTANDKPAEPGTPKPPRTKPLDAKSAEAEFRRLATSAASTRFRESASAQIAAARDRISQRNLSGAMTMALAIGVLSAGVAGGAGYLAGLGEKTTTHAQSLEQSILRIEAEMMALRNEIVRASRLAAASAGDTGERLDRIEKAQGEPLIKLGKLAEMIEKLRSAHVAPLASSRPDAADVTGSITPQTKTRAAAQPAVIEAWVLREYDKDVALIEGKRGLLEIAVGDDIPGVGRVEGFRKHEGRWAVVTTKGLIVSR